MFRRRAMNRAQQGLTLIEIMVVLVIIGLVMGVLMRRVFSTGDKAKRRLAEVSMDQIKQSIMQYRLQYNDLPKSLEDLTGCNETTGQSCVPLADEDEMLDPWGEKFKYSVTDGGRAYEITSLGADRRVGGEGVNADFSKDGP